MRPLVCLILLLAPLAARAETRVGIHAAGGLEALMLKEVAPAHVVEAGLAIDHVWSGANWGVAARAVRIGRGYDDVADEWKADAGLMFTNRTHTQRMMVGVGIRSLTIPGGEARLPSVIRGFDLLRLDSQVQLVRRGVISLDVFAGWTVGYYHGERYQERIGDVMQTTRPVTMLTNAYVFGLQTSFTLD